MGFIAIRTYFCHFTPSFFNEFYCFGLFKSFDIYPLGNKIQLELLFKLVFSTLKLLNKSVSFSSIGFVSSNFSLVFFIFTSVLSKGLKKLNLLTFLPFKKTSMP